MRVAYERKGTASYKAPFETLNSTIQNEEREFQVKDLLMQGEEVITLFSYKKTEGMRITRKP